MSEHFDRFAIEPFETRFNNIVYMVRDAEWITDDERREGKRPPVIAQFDDAVTAADYCDCVADGTLPSVPHESEFIGWPELKARVASTGVTDMSDVDVSKMFDDLETEDFTQPATATPERNPNAFRNDRVEGSFTEACPKCDGSGRFYGHSGRLIGQCFKCKGKGKLTFKQSPETRKRAAEARQKQKEKRATERVANIQKFHDEHPEVCKWIAEAAPTFEFAAAMSDAILKYGSLTPKQLAACERCIQKRKEAREARAQKEANAPEISIEKIGEAFASAKASGLKWPKLSLGAFTFKPAGDNSKNAGAIYVTENNEYLGKIVSGKFVAVKSCGDERQAAIIDAAADPEKAAVAHGHLTGACSCCGRELTNPESVKRGIGPICARKYGW